MTRPPCSPKGIIDEAEPGFFREWLQDLTCNHLINSIHSQHAGPPVQPEAGNPSCAGSAFI